MSSYPILHSLSLAHVPRGPIRFSTIEVLSNNIGVVQPGRGDGSTRYRRAAYGFFVFYI